MRHRGKSVSLQASGRSGYIRLDARSMGQEYDLSELAAVLAGKKAHIPSAKKSTAQIPPKVNLLVDVQEKLQAGKGAGYMRWASSFNLKQMAQTLNYLTEHKLLDYADLSKKAAGASAEYHDLSGKIKAAEKRMAGIAVLKTPHREGAASGICFSADGEKILLRRISGGKRSYEGTADGQGQCRPADGL